MLTEATPFRILEFLASNGRIPFRDWLNRLDISIKARIQGRDIKKAQQYLAEYLGGKRNGS